MESLVPYILAVVPTIGVAGIFYVVIKNIIEADRRERMAQRKWELEQQAEKNRADS